MTIREGAVISAHTGTMVCKNFSYVQEYIEEILGRPVFTHEIPALIDEVKEKSKEDFIKIIEEQTE